MKKVLVSVLVFIMLLSLAACGNSDVSQDPSVDDGSVTDISSAADSSDQESTADESVTESSDDESSETTPGESADESAYESSEEVPDESSEETPDESSEEVPDEGTAPDFISNFISYGAVTTNVRADSDNSVRLTGVDVGLSFGSVVLYTYKTPSVTGLKDFAVARFEYSQTKFGYVKTEFIPVGESASTVKTPKDGFIVAAHKSQTDIINRLSSMPGDQTVFAHGVQPCKDIGYTAKKLSGSIEFDGIAAKGEWDSYLIDKIDSSNKYWSYAQFTEGNYYATASYYTAYDNDYIYLCVIVDSPYHYCPIAASNAGSMWQYECIQVKMTSLSPASDYFLEHYDHVIDNTANADGTVRAYGFAVNDDGETCYYENAIIKEFGGKAACSRDDAAQKTVYEVAIPWAEYGITPSKGMQIGLTFSINSTNEEDIGKGVWKNITYRDGGGVIGRNDWSKIPVVTLG